jgi:hypothetical protein
MPLCAHSGATLAGCIHAEIKPPSSSQYFIAFGNATAQHNIEVAKLLRGQRKAFSFVMFNPELEGEWKILPAKQELLPPGLDGLRFVVQQPDRPLRSQEEVPVQLMVSTSSNVPVTKVPKQSVRVPYTAGGTAVPPLRKRSAAAPISIAVKPAQRLYLTATGTVDLDGSGRLPSVGPDGKDFSDQPGSGIFSSPSSRLAVSLAS